MRFLAIVSFRAYRVVFWRIDRKIHTSKTRRLSGIEVHAVLLAVSSAVVEVLEDRQVAARVLDDRRRPWDLGLHGCLTVSGWLIWRIGARAIGLACGSINLGWRGRRGDNSGGGMSSLRGLSAWRGLRGLRNRWRGRRCIRLCDGLRQITGGIRRRPRLGSLCSFFGRLV